ncbi:MAG: tetratricopeptide repeat protein [Nitrospirae bacterium]|nr:tetratricopeptide repeat protein [Nitrospirota bacterium]
MTESFPDMLLPKLNEFVADQMGLYFPKERARDLGRGISAAARAFGFKDAETCIGWLLSSPLTKSQIEILAGFLTVGETYFFRERKCFEILEERILPELIRSRRKTEPRLRIWSAGCCTGEEPYSIAILLDKLLPDLKNWNITILATDINPRFLQKASEGLYAEWSFRDSPAWIKERCFERKKGGRFEILPAIKKRVTFSYLNLAEDVYPSLTNNTNAMDVIFCRNVLMYFAPERARRVIQNLYRSLINGGWLTVSPSETSQALFSQFATVNLPGVILYRKVSGSEFQVSSLGSHVANDQHEPETLNVELETSVEYETLNVQPETSDFKLETSSLKPETSDPALQKPDPYMDAAVLYERGRYAEASEKIVRLLSDRPDDEKAMVLLARVYANQGRLAEAFQWCQRAIAADKLAAGRHYLLATVLQEQDQMEEAVLSLKRALYLDPDFVLAHFALGHLSRQQGRLKESAKHFENALALLNQRRPEEVLPESEGLTVGRLMEIIRSTTFKETAA